MDSIGHHAHAFSDLHIAALSPGGAEPLNILIDSECSMSPNSFKWKSQSNLMTTRGKTYEGPMSPAFSPSRRISTSPQAGTSPRITPPAISKLSSCLNECGNRFGMYTLPDPAMLGYRHSSIAQACSPTCYHDSTPSVLFYPSGQGMGSLWQSRQWPSFTERPSFVERPTYVSTRSGANGFNENLSLNYLSPRYRAADLSDPVHIIPSSFASSAFDASTKDEPGSSDSVPMCVSSRSFSTTSANSSSGHQGETTLMLRNLPNKYTRDMVLAEIEERGLKKDIDFFYLPIDLRHRCNVGYCFVNMVSKDAANRFRAAFQGVKLLQVKSGKTCEVSAGKVQGLEANIEAYRNSAVITMSEKYHPLLFVNGEPTAFPPPTLSREELRQLKPEKKGVSTRAIKPQCTRKKQNAIEISV